MLSDEIKRQWLVMMFENREEWREIIELWNHQLCNVNYVIDGISICVRHTSYKWPYDPDSWRVYPALHPTEDNSVQITAQGTDGKYIATYSAKQQEFNSCSDAIDFAKQWVVAQCKNRRRL